MKKLLAILLTLTLVAAFASCGGNGGEEEKASTVTDTVTEKAAEPEKIEAEAVSIGNTITLDFAEITVNEAAVADDIRTSIKTGSITYTSGPQSSSSTEFVYVRGKIKNLSKSEISNPNVIGNVEIDGYSYEIKDFDIIEADGSSAYSIAPLVEYTYTMYAEIPNELAESMASCDMNFGFAEMFESQAVFNGETPELPYNYKITITK